MSALTTQTNTSLQKIDGRLATIPAPMLHPVQAPVINTEMKLHDILEILNRQKILIISTILLFLGLAVWYTLSTPPSYRASAIVQIERDGTQIVTFGQTSQAVGSFDTDKDPFFRTRYELLKSRLIAKKVIDELNLYSSLVPVQEEKTFSLSSLKSIFGSDESTVQKTPERIDYPSIFLHNLLVQPIGGTHLVEVFYEAPSAEEAKNIVSSLINNFIKGQIETKSETGQYAKEFLSQQLAESRKRLRNSEEALVKYANDKGILGVDDKQTRHVKKLENLDAALVKAEIDRIEAESLYQQMKKVGSVSAVLTNPVVGSLKGRLVQLEGDYQEMLKTFKPNYPDMVRLKQQINNVRGKLQKEMVNIQRSMRSDFLAAKRQEDKIRTELSHFNRKMYDLQNSSVDYNTLKREVNTNGKLYNNLLQRLDEVNVASAVNTSNISIIEPAIVPFSKYRPRPKLNIIIGLFSGLLLGLGLAFLRDALDHTIKSPEELERFSGLPVLGMIPRVAKASLKKNLGMVTIKSPQSFISEAYRVTSTNIRFMVNSAQSKPVLLITSAQANQGKSTTATNIAISYAQMGLKVLLVDADIRSSSLHQNLKISNKFGLTHYLKGEIDLVGITQPVKNIPGLYAITSGAYSPDPISLLSHERMSYLTTQGASIFDYVIIDAPPVEGFADALILSSLATSTIIVAKESGIESKRTHHVLKQLSRVKNNVLGFLLVDVKKPNVNSKFYSRTQRKNAKRALLESKKATYA